MKVIYFFFKHPWIFLLLVILILIGVFMGLKGIIKLLWKLISWPFKKLFGKKKNNQSCEPVHYQHYQNTEQLEKDFGFKEPREQPIVINNNIKQSSLGEDKKFDYFGDKNNKIKSQHSNKLNSFD